MKKLFTVNLLIVLAVVFASCGTNNNVVNNRLISKRKHTKGFHINWRGNAKSSNEKAQEENLASNNPKNDTKKSKKSVRVENEKKANRNETSRSQESTVFEGEFAAVTEEKQSNPGERRTQDSFDADGLETEKDAYPADVTEEKQEQSSNESKKNLQHKKKKNNSSNSSDSMFILIVILTVLIPPLGVAVYTNIDWMKTLICLLLTFLFYIPGLIYGLLVVFDVI